MSDSQQSVTGDEFEDVDPEEAIGVYKISVEGDSLELVRLALWTPDGWTKTSNGGMVAIAPEEKTLEGFKDEFHGSRMRVEHPADVEAEVTVGDPPASVEEMGLDVEIRD